MTRVLLSRITCLVVAAMLSLAGPAFADETPTFRFRSSFWLNLHHFLFHQAEAATTPLVDDDAWRDAVHYYRDHYISRSLLRDPAMIALDQTLGDSPDDATQPSDTLNATIVKVLSGAAPIYRERFWPDHQRANDAWLELVSPLLDKHGKTVEKRLAAAYQERWPDEPILVDLLVYANWAGAYTTRHPNHIRIGTLYPPPSTPADEFETLMHEGSHILMTRKGPIQRAVSDECKQREIDVPRDLWHAIMFFQTGEIVRRSPATPDEYVPYAQSHGLSERGPWKLYFPAMEKHWTPYLDGDSDIPTAMRGLFSELEQAPAKPTRPPKPMKP